MLTSFENSFRDLCFASQRQVVCVVRSLFIIKAAPWQRGSHVTKTPQRVWFLALAEVNKGACKQLEALIKPLCELSWVITGVHSVVGVTYITPWRYSGKSVIHNDARLQSRAQRVRDVPRPHNMQLPNRY